MSKPRGVIFIRGGECHLSGFRDGQHRATISFDRALHKTTFSKRESAQDNTILESVAFLKYLFFNGSIHLGRNLDKLFLTNLTKTLVDFRKNFNRQSF